MNTYRYNSFRTVNGFIGLGIGNVCGYFGGKLFVFEYRNIIDNRTIENFKKYIVFIFYSRKYDKYNRGKKSD